MKNKTITVFGMLCLTLLFINGCKKEKVVKNPPTACFTVSSSNVTVGEQIDFTNCTTGGVTYVWNFGDGETSTNSSPEHTYTSSGTYTVTLTATNADGTTTKTKTITVTFDHSVYSGNFDVEEDCDLSGVYTYTASITISGTQTVILGNFYDYGESLQATANGRNLTIPSQTLDLGGMVTVSGSGTLSANYQTLTLNVTITDGTDTNVCTIVYTKI